MKKRIINVHHCIYPSEDHPEQEFTVRVTKGEHFCLGRLNIFTRRFISRGLLTALKFFIAINEHRAEDL